MRTEERSLYALFTMVKGRGAASGSDGCGSGLEFGDLGLANVGDEVAQLAGAGRQPFEVFGGVVLVAVEGRDIGALEQFEAAAMGALLAGAGLDEACIHALGERAQELDVVGARTPSADTDLRFVSSACLSAATEKPLDERCAVYSLLSLLSTSASDSSGRLESTCQRYSSLG